LEDFYEDEQTEEAERPEGGGDRDRPDRRDHGGRDGPAPAQALPSYASTCTGCHTAGGSVTATPSSATLASGAAYTVAIAITAASTGNSGYWIATSDASGAAGTSVTTGGPAAGTTFSAAMTAPTAAGTYYYKVWANKGSPPGAASSVLYSITVAAAGTTPPPTTVPPVTPPPTTVPPVTPPPTTLPPVTPPVLQANIRSLSPTHAAVGTKITIRGTGFGTPGSVKFGTVTAKVSSWTQTSIVVTVPATSGVTPWLESDVTGPVWYRHAPTILVTETPDGAAASNAVSFRLDSHNQQGRHENKPAASHQGRHEGERN
jgi:IPT/TIG domain